MGAEKFNTATRGDRNKTKPVRQRTPFVDVEIRKTGTDLVWLLIS
jgi:hypothetical protein